MLAHADETDDSHAPSLCYPGCAIVPAALAAALASGADFVRVNVHTHAALTDQGVISGRATLTGTFGITVQVTDSAQPAKRVATRALTLTSPFAKLSPSNNQKLARTTSTTLSWYAYSGATGYELCVTSSSKGCGTSGWVAYGSGTTSTSVTVSAGASYYWQVRALTGAGTVTANGTSYWKFSISR